MPQNQVNPYQQALGGLQMSYQLPGSRFQPSAVQGRFSNPLDENATVFPPDTDAALAALQDQRMTELQRNIASGGAGPVGPINLADLRGDIQKNPLTQQREDVATSDAANRAAMMQGFHGGPVRQVDTNQYESGIVDSPAQQMAKATRGME